MKAAFWADYLSCKKTLLQQIPTTLIIALCICLPIGNIYAVTPVIAITVTLSTAFTLFALDEQNGWEGFRASLPMSRAAIIGSRMLFIAAVAIAFALLGMAASALLSAIAPAALPLFAPLFSIDPAGFELDAEAIALIGAISIAVSAVIVGITTPLVARFGMTRAIRFIPLAFVAVFVAGFVLAEPLGFEDGMASFMENLLRDPWLASAVLLAGSAGVAAASGALAARLYEGREF